MIEVLFLVFASTFGIVVIGLLLLWVKSTLIGESSDVVEPVDGLGDTSRRVALAQERWREMQMDVISVGRDLDGDDILRLDRAEENVEARSVELQEAWSPLRDVAGGSVAFYNDMSRHIVNNRKTAALAAVERFEEALDSLELLINSMRR